MRFSNMPKPVAYGFYLALGGGFFFHLFHGGETEAVPIPPFFHWLRDSFLAVPIGLLAVALTMRMARSWGARFGLTADGIGVGLLWSLMAAVAYVVASIPANLVHAALFLDHAHPTGIGHAVGDAAAVLDPAFVLLALAVSIVGPPWRIDRAPLPAAQEVEA